MMASVSASLMLITEIDATRRYSDLAGETLSYRTHNMPSFGTLKADTLTHSTAGSLATNYVVNGSAKVGHTLLIKSQRLLKTALTHHPLIQMQATGNSLHTYSSAFTTSAFHSTQFSSQLQLPANNGNLNFWQLIQRPRFEYKMKMHDGTAR